jgi:hypothetical protein
VSRVTLLRIARLACDEHHNTFKPPAKNDGLRTMALRGATGVRLFT